MTIRGFTELISVLPDALEGFSDEEVAKLAKPEELRKGFNYILGRGSEDEEIQKFLEERNFKIVEDLEQGDPVPVATTRLISFLEEDEKWVVSEKMLERSRSKGASGGIRQALHDKAHADEIPKSEWDLVRVYTQTILRGRGSGILCVLVLYRRAGQWDLSVLWLAVSSFPTLVRSVAPASDWPLDS